MRSWVIDYLANSPCPFHSEGINQTVSNLGWTYASHQHTNHGNISDSLLRIETRAHQRWLGSKIETKFSIFTPHPVWRGGARPSKKLESGCQKRDTSKIKAFRHTLGGLKNDRTKIEGLYHTSGSLIIAYFIGSRGGDWFSTAIIWLS